MLFQLDVSAATLDPTLDSQPIYTQIATAEWGFNADGNIRPGLFSPYTWFPVAGDGFFFPTSWKITGGVRSPTPNVIFKIEAARVDFH
jgi:hypothetical protein